MDTPKGFNLLGAIMADLDGNEINETAYYNHGRKLVIYEANQQKWESPSSFGSIKSMLIDDIVNESNAPKGVPVWPQSALFSVDNALFAVVPANQVGIWGMVGGSPKNGRLGLLCPNNGTYAFRFLTTKFQGPVQSIFTYNNELYIAVVDFRSLPKGIVSRYFNSPIRAGGVEKYLKDSKDLKDAIAIQFDRQVDFKKLKDTNRRFAKTEEDKIYFAQWLVQDIDWKSGESNGKDFFWECSRGLTACCAPCFCRMFWRKRRCVFQEKLILKFISIPSCRFTIIYPNF